MNYIFIDVNKQDKDYKIINRAINENIYIKELCFSKAKIEQIMLLKRIKEKNIFKRAVNRYRINSFEKNILKEIKELYDNEEKVYLTSKKLSLENEVNSYIQDLFIKLNIKEYIYEGEYVKNIPTHIKDYCDNNICKPAINSKVLIIYKDLDNIDIQLLQKLIDVHKTVNILAIDDISKYQVNKIKKINEINGTTISVINKNKKAFKDYDIALFMDATYNETKKLRFTKESLKIYVLDIEKDSLDRNYIYLQKLQKESKVLETVVDRLQSIYGQNTVASIIIKLHKSIDKKQKME